MTLTIIKDKQNIKLHNYRMIKNKNNNNLKFIFILLFNSIVMIGLMSLISNDFFKNKEAELRNEHNPAIATTLIKLQRASDNNADYKYHHDKTDKLKIEEFKYKSFEHIINNFHNNGTTIIKKDGNYIKTEGKQNHIFLYVKNDNLMGKSANQNEQVQINILNSADFIHEMKDTLFIINDYHYYLYSKYKNEPIIIEKVKELNNAFNKHFIAEEILLKGKEISINMVNMNAIDMAMSYILDKEQYLNSMQGKPSLLFFKLLKNELLTNQNNHDILNHSSILNQLNISPTDYYYLILNKEIHNLQNELLNLAIKEYKDINYIDFNKNVNQQNKENQLKQNIQIEINQDLTMKNIDFLEIANDYDFYKNTHMTLKDIHINSLNKDHHGLIEDDLFFISNITYPNTNKPDNVVIQKTLYLPHNLYARYMSNKEERKLINEYLIHRLN